MRVTICHMGYSGYACAGWRALAACPDVELTVFSVKPVAAFDDTIIRGLPIRLFERSVLNDPKKAQEVADAVYGTRPDVLVCPGWGMPAYRALFFDPRAKSTKLVMSVDCTWTASLRQLLSRLALRSVVGRISAWMAAGERGRIYARYLGVPANKIYTSTYCYDDAAFRECLASRQSRGEWPRRFLYVGRYAPEKGCTTLVAAYRSYRQQVAHPWPLVCYGNGNMKDAFAGEKGIEVHDFVQPTELPQVLTAHGVYILPSLFEPWGVSLAEAAGAGLPLICSDQVSSGVDLVRPLYNGLTFPSGDEAALAQCLVYCSEHVEQLPVWGERSRHYAGAYSAATWAARYQWLFGCLLRK